MINVGETTAGTVKTIGLTGSVAATAEWANINLATAAATTVDTLNIGLSSNSGVTYAGGANH